jgi:hypothetical protein
MCAIEKEELANPNPNGPCKRFCKELHADNPNWKCYHYPILTKEHVAQAQNCWNELKEQYYGEFDHVQEQTWRCPMMISMMIMLALIQRPDPCSIHYEMIPHSTECDNFYEKIIDKLQLCSLPWELVSTYTFSKACDALFLLMKTEMAAQKLIASIEHGTEVPGALFLIMAVVPCILHARELHGLEVPDVSSFTWLSTCSCWWPLQRYDPGNSSVKSSLPMLRQQSTLVSLVMRNFLHLG